MLDNWLQISNFIVFRQLCKDMTNNSYPNIKSLIINLSLKCANSGTLKECRKNFIINAFICFSSIKGKINFLQMERFSDKCEQYFRINFENKFNFQGFNLTMIKERTRERIVAFDPSFDKEGSDKFWQCRRHSVFKC